MNYTDGNVYMISWNIALGLVLIALVLPFVYLRSLIGSLRQRLRDHQTEKEHLRHMLRDLEAHVQNDKSLFLEALGVPFLLVRPSGRLVMANRRAGLLLGMDESRSANLLRVLPEGELRSVIAEAVQLKEPRKMELSLPMNGEQRHFRVRATPLQNVEGHVGIVFHDVTEEHRTQVIRRDFVANASHELRTPLTILRGYLETLLEDPETAADEALRSRSLNTMKKHAERITRLVEDMLTVSRLENADQGYLKMEEFDLQAAVDDVLLRLDAQVRRQSAELSVQIEPRPFVMHGDRFYWAQILFNLMENSLKNNPDPGLHVLLRAEQGGDGHIFITVHDDGVGIAPQAMPYIFNRFYRADTSGRVKGTGLGLSIVKHAVEAHGGTIVARSEQGKCTEFRISLPPQCH